MYILKRVALLFLCLPIASALIAQTDVKSDALSSQQSTHVFDSADQMPTPGYDMQSYLAQNTIYPGMAKDGNIEGEVHVSAVVTEDGTIVDGKVTNGLGYGCDEEAVRVISNMPAWKSGMRNGIPVKVRISVVVSFKKDDPTQMIYRQVEQPPEPGYVMNEYLGSSLRYPKEAREKNLQGRVVIQFVVDETGQITNAKVLKGISKELDDEAWRVIRSMPKWKPGRQEGKPVKVYYMQPINFTLQ